MSFSQPIFYFMVRRLHILVAAFASLVIVGGAAALAFGDGDSVTVVHFHNIVQHNYALIRVLTDYGLYPFYLLFAGMLTYGLVRGDRWYRLMGSAYLFAQLAGSFLAVRVLKMGLGRARPDATPLPGYESQWVGFTWDGHFHSFPSGHTADIVTSAIFTGLMVRSPWLAGIAVAWAVALAFTRLALAKHYPSDALAGTVIAVTVSYLVARLWLNPRLEQPPPFPVPRWWQER